MAEDDLPPAEPEPADRTAWADGWLIGVPPAVFLVHFAAVYGWVGLACSFRWDTAPWAGALVVHAVVVGLTVLAVALLWWARPARAPLAADTLDPYDPAEREHFMSTTTLMLGWLAMAGMLAVTLPVLLANTCSRSP